MAVVLLAVAACGSPGPIDTAAPSPDARPTPAPALVASLSFEPTGIVRCGSIPDWVCTHFIQVEGSDGIVHEGFFDIPIVGTPPPTYAILGDVPTQLAPGRYRITFVKQRVSDVSSEQPVPGETRRLTNRSDVFATCETAFEVLGSADIRIQVDFAEATCTATTAITPRG